MVDDNSTDFPVSIDVYMWKGEEKVLKSGKELVDELENFERNFFRNRDEPTLLCQKCDACRAIAYRLDAEFEAAEAKMGIIPIYNYDEGKTFNIVIEIYSR